MSALFTWYRLSSWLPAVATGDKEYSAGTAWRATRKNRAAYVFFTFWLLFSCAIAGALGAAAVFGAQNSGVNWATPVAFGFTGLLGWLALFLVCTIATSHYCHFAQRDVFPKNEG